MSYFVTNTLMMHQVLHPLLLMLFHYLTDDVDTRAITRRLRQDGSLIGVLSTEALKTDDELLELSRSWDIVGKGLM